MDSTNEIAVAQRWVSEMHVRGGPGVVWTVSGGVPRSANLTLELEALVSALRDAEILVLGTVPSAFISAPHVIF